MTEPFCDFVGVTVPADEWAGLRVDLSAELDAIGMGVEVDQDRTVLWRSSDAFGTVKASRVGAVWAIGCSGTVCAGLRAAGRFMAYLAAIGARPHRVTRLDAAVDYQVDAAPIVAALAQAGRRGELSLTRKGIAPSAVESYTGLRADGVETGTVYCGSKSSDVRMVVYDKQHERARRKLPDVGPRVRYELRLRGGTGVTLRDCAEPHGAFWHYAAPDFLPAPPNAVPWVAGGTGYALERVAPLGPAERLKRRVDCSAELASLIALAGECGPYGAELLLSMVRGRLGVRAQPAETAVCANSPVDPAAIAAALLSSIANPPPRPLTAL
jgi:hypothetical protein